MRVIKGSRMQNKKDILCADTQARKRHLQVCKLTVGGEVLGSRVDTEGARAGKPVG